MRVREAVLPDAEQIHSLIGAYSGDGTLLPRSLAEICENVRDFVVLERDDQIIGCGALHLYGAHLAEITRTAVGEFTLDQAGQLPELDQEAKTGRLEKRIIRLESLLPELPRATILPIVEKRVRHGAKFNLSLAQIQPGQTNSIPGAPAQLDSGEWKPSRLRVFNQQGQLIAIAEPVVPRTYQPVVVLEAIP